MPVTEEEPIPKSNNDGLGALVPLMLLGVLGFFVYRSYRAQGRGGTTRGMRAQPDSDGINLMSRVSSAVASAGGRVSAHASTRALYSLVASGRRHTRPHARLLTCHPARFPLPCHYPLAHPLRRTGGKPSHSVPMTSRVDTRTQTTMACCNRRGRRIDDACSVGCNHRVYKGEQESVDMGLCSAWFTVPRLCVCL